MSNLGIHCILNDTKTYWKTNLVLMFAVIALEEFALQH